MVKAKKPVANFILDFYCAKLRLALEIDGETHIETKNIFYDRKRTNELEKRGIKVLRFWNYDILEGLGEVENIIEKEIRKREEIFILNQSKHKSPPNHLC